LLFKGDVSSSTLVEKKNNYSWIKILNFIKNIKETFNFYMPWCGCRLAPLTLHTFTREEKKHIYI